MDRARLQRFEKPQSLDIDGFLLLLILLLLLLLLLLQSNDSIHVMSSQPRLSGSRHDIIMSSRAALFHLNSSHPILSRLAPQIKITPMSDLESDTDSAGGPCPHQPGMNFLR